MVREKYYSQSKIKTWRRCHKAYDYRYGQGLVRRTAPVALLRGTTLHAMLEANIKGGDWMVPLGVYAEQYGKLWAEEAEQYPHPDELKGIYERYQKHWANDGLTYDGRAEVELIVEHRGIIFKGIIDAFPQDRQQRIWLSDHKCLDSNHLVQTQQGMVRMGDLSLHHQVVSSQGSFIGITEICHQVLPGFEIELKGGKKLRATAEHRWPAMVGTRPGRTVYQVVDTQSLLKYPVAYLLPQPAWNNPTDSQLPISPYVLGALIGDGSFTQGVRFCCPEIEILNRVIELLPGNKIKRVSQPPKADSYYISGLRSKIKHLGLQGKRSWEKHIPLGYLLSSETQRWELLCGLMDTDGSVYKNSSYLFVTTSERLCQDIQSLIHGLGGVATVRSPKSNRYQGEKEGRKSYQVKFTLPDNREPPFLLSRKFNSVVRLNPWKFGRSLKVLSVTSLGDIPVTDITVDSDDHLFSVEGILTHNTHKILPDEHTRFSDIQTVLYYWMAKQEKLQVDGILWDYLRTKPPAIPEVLKSGGLSKRVNIDTDRATYEAEIRKHKLDPANYQDILAKVDKNVFFQRIYLPNPSSDLIHNVVTEAFDTATEIENSTSTCRNMTRDCKSCTFYPICSAEVRGIDSSFIRKQLFTIREEKS